MQITYFPYLFLDRQSEIGFGDIKVWNFSKKATQYVRDVKLRSYIRKLLYSNISNKKPIKDIGVLSIGDTNFREFNSEELETANEVRLVLFLSFLALNNTTERGANVGLFMATSENFEFIRQDFQPSTEHIAEQSGHIVTMLVGGHKIGEKKFYSPSYVPRPQKFSLDDSLINQLLRLKKRGGKKLYKRILRATDLIFESYYNNSNVSNNARALLQIAAFETLLNIPTNSQRKHFKDSIEKYCNLPGEKQYLHSYETREGKKLERISLKAIWADNYYTLRNHIIHGNKIGLQRFLFKGKQRHLDIAILFFVLLVKKLINEKVKKKAFYDEIVWGKTNNGRDVYEGFIYQKNELRSLVAKFLTRAKVKKEMTSDSIWVKKIQKKEPNQSSSERIKTQ